MNDNKAKKTLNDNDTVFMPAAIIHHYNRGPSRTK